MAGVESMGCDAQPTIRSHSSGGGSALLYRSLAQGEDWGRPPCHRLADTRRRARDHSRLGALDLRANCRRHGR